MLGIDDLRRMLADPEADHVERTRAFDARKVGEAICAFGNDLPDRRATGVLFVGVRDDGGCANLAITDELLLKLIDFARDGRVTPLPIMSVRAETIDGCRLAVVEVEPSENPPVKFDGRVCVRRGPQRGYATGDEERRLTEKRRWGALPFDQQPVPGTSIADLDLVRFRLEYLPSAIAPDVLAENGRNLADQLRALRLLWRDGRATAAGLLVLGIDPVAFLPGAYVQFVRYDGAEIGEVIRDEKRIDGPLAAQLALLDAIIDANIENRSDLSGARQVASPTYPRVAVQELLRNAVIHRNFEGTATPVRLTWFDDRIEILSPGGPYGEVTTENFGQPGVTAYRNPAVAEAAKALGYAQRFGSGIARAQAALARNGNPPAEFAPTPQFVQVTIRAAP
ncbi:MAG: putative DNA binding domain-containing protein [Acetobacteraceae bacterium]|nr:putative DNA binding domain-containing protein [Acetobacteraceae bacterium]